jgi:hypothetical protein
MTGDKCGHGNDGVTGVTGVAAAVAQVIGMVAIGLAWVTGAAAGFARAMGVATGVAWVGTRSLWSKAQSQIRGLKLAFNGHGVLAWTATAIRSRVTAILLGVLVVVLGLVPSGGSAAGSSIGGDRSVAITNLADTVVIKNFAFGPTSLAVAPGTQITVVNRIGLRIP